MGVRRGERESGRVREREREREKERVRERNLLSEELLNKEEV